jgi:hypothetical protein
VREKKLQWKGKRRRSRDELKSEVREGEGKGLTQRSKGRE